jgi:hypothetical protein
VITLHGALNLEALSENYGRLVAGLEPHHSAGITTLDRFPSTAVKQNFERSASGRHSQLTTWPRSSVEFPVQLTGPRASPSVSQPYHAFPAPDGSRGSPKDTSLVDFVFARTMRESVGHPRTRHRHGSGP